MLSAGLYVLQAEAAEGAKRIQEAKEEMEIAVRRGGEKGMEMIGNTPGSAPVTDSRSIAQLSPLGIATELVLVPQQQQ